MAGGCQRALVNQSPDLTLLTEERIGDRVTVIGPAGEGE